MSRIADPKTESLRARRALHPGPERVHDPLFQDSKLFDPRDLVQVKYEMLRRVAVDGSTVTAATAAFGLSRPSFYEARKAFGAGGLPGLLPKKRGPRRAHKLTGEVLDFVEELRSEGIVDGAVLAGRVAERFAVVVHPRSIERALRRRGKKRR